MVAVLSGVLRLLILFSLRRDKQLLDKGTLSVVDEIQQLHPRFCVARELCKLVEIAVGRSEELVTNVGLTKGVHWLTLLEEMEEHFGISRACMENDSMSMHVDRNKY